MRGYLTLSKVTQTSHEKRTYWEKRWIRIFFLHRFAFGYEASNALSLSVRERCDFKQEYDKIKREFLNIIRTSSDYYKKGFCNEGFLVDDIRLIIEDKNTIEHVIN